jgi:hypothetical protein
LAFFVIVRGLENLGIVDLTFERLSHMKWARQKRLLAAARAMAFASDTMT